MKTSTLRKYLLFMWPMVATLNSCDLINPAEQIPAYLEINSVTLTTSPGQGSASSKITDVWIDANSAQQGVYEIPKTFPVIDHGQTDFIISAGIMDNGVAATRAIYPFYYPDTLTLDLADKQIYPLTPHFSYRSATKFSFIEDFEAGNIFQKISGDTDLIRITGSADVFEGNYSGLISLDKEHPVYEGRTSNSYILPFGEPVYVELNYKCTQAFQVGLYGISQSSGNIFDYKWQINPRDTWNKIYLNMTGDAKEINADSYQILVRAIFDTTQTSSQIFIDNIKLVNF